MAEPFVFPGQEGTRTSGRTLAVLLVLLVSLCALGLHASRYYPFYSDDALISLRYAERLMQGHGLTWNDGEWVEGYTNLLWVLACALLGSLGIDLILALRLLGALGMAAAIVAIIWRFAPRDARSSLPSLAGALGMALTGSFAVWTVGGLEQPFVAGLLAWALVLSLPLIEAAERGTDGAEPLAAPTAILLPGSLYALLCLTRPDAVLFIGTACAVVVFVGRLRPSAWRSALWLALPTALILASHLAFRLVYYDAWVPNTAHAKLAFTAHRLSGGLGYWWGGVLPLMGLLLPAAAQIVMAAAVDRAARSRTLLLLAMLAVWSGWVIAIGGDIFPGRRHLVAVVVPLAFLSAECWRTLLARFRGRAAAVPWLLASLSLALLATMQWQHDRNHLRAIEEIRWATQGEALGRLLGEAFREERPLVAATAAGALPFYSKLPALDMLGLNDRFLAENPPKGMGQGRIGHELGDGQYFLRRQPDLVVFCGTRGGERACSRGGREMQGDPRFAQEYRLVHFLATKPARTISAVWVRQDSARIGIQRGSGSSKVEVPAYLFSNSSGGSSLGPDGVIGVYVDVEHGATLRGLRLAPGHWKVRAEASGDISIELRHHSDGRRFATGQGRVALELLEQDGGQVDVTLYAGDGGERDRSEDDVDVARSSARVHVRRLLFHRTPPSAPAKAPIDTR